MSSLDGAFSGKRILLGVTGSIAAYKAPFILRDLVERGAEVQVVLTHSAEEFVGKATFSGLGAAVSTDIWKGTGEPHVQLASWADCLLIAPATAHFIASLAAGNADNLLAATALCFSGPTFVAPAMHPRMWGHPASAENVARLVSRGVGILGPVHGRVASGDEGVGRMLEPSALVSRLGQLLTSSPRSLQGRHIVVTAGPTREAIDPVRAITNLSTGKMGYALASEAAKRGARVTLISGPVALGPPPFVQVVSVESALQMDSALSLALSSDLSGADALIMAAAVSDYRPSSPQAEKLKRSDRGIQINLTPNPDILAGIGRRRIGSRPILVGFALETAHGDQLVRLAREKLEKKGADLIVANAASESIGREDNTVHLVSAAESVALGRLQKPLVAAQILDWVEHQLARDTEPSA